MDEPPIFSETAYRWNILENTPIGTEVGTAYAKDMDTTNNPVRSVSFIFSCTWLYPKINNIIKQNSKTNL